MRLKERRMYYTATVDRNRTHLCDPFVFAVTTSGKRSPTPYSVFSSLLSAAHLPQRLCHSPKTNSHRQGFSPELNTDTPRNNSKPNMPCANWRSCIGAVALAQNKTSPEEILRTGFVVKLGQQQPVTYSNCWSMCS